MSMRTLAIVLAVLVVAPAAYAGTDPCFNHPRNSRAFDVSTGGEQQLIPGVVGQQIYVCGFTFTGSNNPMYPTGYFNISFAPGAPGCSGPSVGSALGILRPDNGALVSVGGNSTQFVVPAGSDLCVELGGVTPLAADGWITFIQR